jgi:hypothetical protein
LAQPLLNVSPVVQGDHKLLPDAPRADTLGRLTGVEAFHVQAVPPEGIGISRVGPFPVKGRILATRRLHKTNLFQPADHLQVLGQCLDLAVRGCAGLRAR